MTFFEVFILYVRKNLHMLKYILILSFCFILLYFDLRGNIFFDKFKQVVYFRSVEFSNFFFYPVIRVVDYVHSVKKSSLMKFSEYISSDNSIQTESYSTFDRSYFLALKDENRILKQQLNFIDNYKVAEGVGYRIFKYITSQSLGGVYNFSSHSIIIPIGFDNGIRKNNIVINKDGLIGKVIKIEKNAAHVMCIDDFLFRIPVSIGGAHIQAVLSGYGKGKSLKLLYIDDLPIHQGDLVVTSGVYNESPSDIAIGVIDDNLFVEPFVDFKNIGILSVFIVDNEINNESDTSNN